MEAYRDGTIVTMLCTPRHDGEESRGPMLEGEAETKTERSSCGVALNRVVREVRKCARRVSRVRRQCERQPAEIMRGGSGAPIAESASRETSSH